MVDLLGRPHGIILVTGPTGSGKTTTLYSMLNHSNEPSVKIITTEDPVEYDLDGIVQVPINDEIGVSYAAVLRTILRQDPDRILVGETRDLETAKIAIEASLTGHLVFSTVHTNDAPSTVDRLVDLGVEPFLLSRPCPRWSDSDWCAGSAAAARPSTSRRTRSCSSSASIRGARRKTFHYGAWL